jgi:putative DNA primase/helicase
VSAADEIMAVLTYRQRLWANRYRPIAVCNHDQTVDDNGNPLRNPGKQPRGRWRDDGGQNPPRSTLERPDPRATNTGVLTGDVAPIDIDLLDPELARQVTDIAFERFGETLVRIGREPKTLLLYEAETPFKKIMTPDLVMPDGTSAKIEILALGQQFVVAGIHPQTQAPYRWLGGRSPENTPRAELPVITETEAREFIREAEAVLRATGATDRKKPEPEQQKKHGKPGNGEDPNFFDYIKREAMANLAAWVPELFPRAKLSPNRAYRISSKELGRDLEEDLSIHSGGIRDFGTEENLTVIDVVLRHGGARTPYEAARWLAERPGIGVDSTKQKSRWDLPEPDPPEPEPDDQAAAADNVHQTSSSPPTITVEAGKRHIAADQGIAALVAAKVPFYQRNRRIVRIARVKAKDSDGNIFWVPGIVEVEPPIMGRELGRSAYWYKWDGRKKDYVRIDPPAPVAEQILSMAGEWPFEPLQGIIQCPTLRRDGTLLDKEGYDEKTGLVLIGSVAMPPISPAPSHEDAESALDLLTGLLSEFPFADEVSKAVALSMFITPVIRGAMTVAPMHLVTKPLPGTGASYLLDCAAMIATGEVCAVEAMAPKYEETEKRLVGAALSGFPIIAVDNVRESVAGDFFCQVVERPLMSLRALGSSGKHRIPNTFTVFANGNNATVAEDLVRRNLRCGMDANMEHPEEREFSFDPLAAIRNKRGEYIAAALTIPLAYIAAGRPNRQPPLLSFGGWSRMVREPLIWLGCADPVASQAKLRLADPQKELVAEIFDAWRSALGTGVGHYYHIGEVVDAAAQHPELRSAILRVAAERRKDAGPEISTRAFGKWLNRHEGHIAAGVKLSVIRTDARRPKWYIEVR